MPGRCQGTGRGASELRWEDRAGQPRWSDALQSLALAARATACRRSSMSSAWARNSTSSRGERRSWWRWWSASPRPARCGAGALDRPDRGHGASLVESPLDIAQLTERRKASSKAWIFTSATLRRRREARAGSPPPRGLEDALTLRRGSPFDYATHAALWVAVPFPEPNAPAHPAAGARFRPSPAHVRWAGAPSC